MELETGLNDLKSFLLQAFMMHCSGAIPVLRASATSRRICGVASSASRENVPNLMYLIVGHKDATIREIPIISALKSGIKFWIIGRIHFVSHYDKH